MTDTLDPVRTWLVEHPGVFAHAEVDGGLELVEIATAKARTLLGREVERCEARGDGVAAYVIALLENGAQLVLCAQGFAFAPDFRNTGPLEVPTAVLCFRDYAHLRTLIECADEAHRREALHLVMVLIALLDGATAVGLGVERESREVEALLAVLESKSGPA